MSNGPSKHSTDYDNSIPFEKSVKRSRMQTLLTKDFKKKREDNNSVRSAYNSHRPSTTNRTKSSQRELGRKLEREAHREEKNLDINNYLDHTIVENPI